MERRQLCAARQYDLGATADILHVLPLALTMALGLRIIAAGMRGISSRGARIGLTVVALLAIALCGIMVALGASNPDPNSVGVHTFEDWMPVIVLNTGTLLWLATRIFHGRTAQA
jgi:hypothetical protein